MIRKLDITEKSALIKYLIDVDKDFEIPMSTKILIPNYAEKILQKGVVLVIEENSEFCALISLYLNDDVNHIGYISVLSVKTHKRGKGYARKLVKEAIALSKSSGMDSISVDSVNPIAISLYESLGFVRYKIEDSNGLEKVYLSKSLKNDML